MKHKIYTRRVFSIFLVFAYLLCGGSALVFAQQAVPQQPGRAGGVVTLTVTAVAGPAELLSKADVEKQRGIRLQSELWKPALPRTLLNSGDQLRTGSGASMELQMNDGTIITLSGDAAVVVEDLKSARGQAPQTTQLLLEKGKIVTQQTARILGQTHQIIRTENGSVNTSLGEVEIWKPEKETEEYAHLAALSSGFPLLAKKVDKSENTYVTLSRGTLVLEAFGIGQLITDSGLLPETCIAQEKIKLTMFIPKHQVMVSKLEDQNGFRVSSIAPSTTSASSQDFYLLVGTEGTANKVRIVTQDSEAEVDVEGINMAKYDRNSGATILKHPLFTVGVKSKDVLVNFVCDETESKGLSIGEVDVREISGGVYADDTFVGGRDTRRPIPSRGRIAGAPTPTPPMTPTPGEEEEEEATPTPTPEEEGPPPPPPGPVTDLRPAAPTIAAISGPTVSVADPSCGGVPLQNRVDLRIEYNDLTPFVVGGNFYRYHPAAPPSIATYTLTVDAPPYLVQSNYQYTYTGGESAYLDYWFCYDPLGALAGTDYQIWIRDADGNPSNTLNYGALP